MHKEFSFRMKKLRMVKTFVAEIKPRWRKAKMSTLNICRQLLRPFLVTQFETLHHRMLSPNGSICSKWIGNGPNFTFQCFLKMFICWKLRKIALLSIFHAYQTKEWVWPPLLKPWLILELACSWKWFTMQRLCLAYSFKPLFFIVTWMC